MASFTDGVQTYLPHGVSDADLINLYDQTLQTKQAQYNLGVQRIQNSYDTVAGLDVMRTMDKQYLQGKLGDLTTQLNQLAGGDFSNQSLVSQAASLAPKLAKDPRIQSAILSTQGVREVVNTGKQLKKDHPELYPIQAETYDSDRIGEYLNSSDPEATFNSGGGATRYLSAHKPLMDFLKEKDPTLQDVNVANGKYTFKHIQTSKITDEELTNLVNGFFDVNPQYQQSVKLDANYAYRGYDPSSLYTKTVGTMKMQLSQYLDKQKSDAERARPYIHNPTYMAQYKKEASSTQTMIDNLSSKIGSYNKMFSDGTPLQSIKTELQMDQVRNTYVSEYKKNNQIEEIKANEDAIHQTQFALESARVGIESSNRDLKYWQAGINPYTGQDLKPGEKGWTVFMADHPAYAKLTSTKSSEGSQSVTISQPNNSGNVDLYSDQGIDKRIEAVKLQITNREGDLRQAFAQDQKDKDGNPLPFDHDKKVFTNANDEAAFRKWEAQQETYILHPETRYQYNPVTGKNEMIHKVEPAYQDWRQEKQQTLAEQQNLQKIKENIGRDADAKFTLDKINKTITIRGVDGNKMDINIGQVAKDSKLIDVAFSVEREASNISEKEQTAASIMQNMGVSQPFGKYSTGESQRKALQTAIDKRKGTREYPYLKSIADSGNWGNLMAQLNGAVGENENNKESYKSIQYKAMASRINPQGTIVDKDDYDEYRGYIAASLQNNPAGAKGIKDLKELIPTAVYTDPLDMQAHIQYTQKDGTTGDVAVPSLNNVIGRPNPDQRLNNIIENSYNKSTPTSGIGTFVTPNCNIKYAIAKNLFDKSSYKLSIIDGESVIQIVPPSNQGKFQSAGEAQRKIEDLSRLINPDTKAPYTTQELIELTKKASK